MGRIFIVDCEASGPCPAKGRLTEFGAVDFNSFMEGSEITFHGVLDEEHDPGQVFLVFDGWLAERCRIRGDYESPIFVSDNPAFDWQWINDAFWRLLGKNPFGHSARRIGDFYAGLTKDFRNTTKWKKFRKTRHDHNPVHDAIGNAEALKQMIDMLDKEEGT
jgi:hypothetical protein